MALDYSAPLYTFRQASEAAAFPLNTLRSYYQREWFSSFVPDVSAGRGVARKLCLGDVLVLAIASRLIDLGIQPGEAWKVGYLFGAITQTRKDGPKRRPFQLFDERAYETVLIWRKGQLPSIVPVAATSRQISVELFSGDEEESAFGVVSVVLPLNALQETVFRKLGLDTEKAQ